MKIIEDLQAFIRELNTKAHGNDPDAYAESKGRGEDLVHQVRVLIENKLNYKQLLSMNICPACGGALKYMGMVYGPSGPQSRKSCVDCKTMFIGGN